MNLVKVNEGKELVVSLGDIAKGSDVQIKALKSNIEKHSDKFKLLGLKEVPSGSYKNLKSLCLTEAQTTFLLTLMNNNDKIIEFKFALVQEFFRMRELLNSGSYIPEELKVFLPKSKFGEENKQGLIKTEPVSGYWRADNKSEKGKLLQKKYQLQKRLNGLFQEEIELELQMIEEEIALLENNG